MAQPEVDLSELTADQQLALQQFTSVTDQGHEDAIPLLQRCQWNVQIAISRFFDGEPSPEADSVVPPRQDLRRQEVLMNGFSSSSALHGRNPDLEPAPRIVAQPEGQHLTRPAPFVLSLLFSPINILYNLLSRFCRVLTYFFPFIPRVVDRIFGRGALGGSRQNTSGRRPLNSRDTAARFLRELEEEYGPHRIPFFESGYAQAYDTAKRDLKFLLVVLLSPEHDDTHAFVQEVLLSREIQGFLEETRDKILVWAGNVQDPEAFQVGVELNCTKFPFGALIVHTPSQSSTAMSTVLRVVGPMSSSSYVSKLRTAIAQHSPDLERARSARAEQQASRDLRNEQNSAYERSLAQDRARTRQRREAEEAQKIAQQRAEAKADAKARNIEKRQQWRRWRASQFSAEPGTDNREAVRISVRLADGQRLVRRFHPSADMEQLYAYVECHDLLPFTSQDPKPEPPTEWSHTYQFKLVSPMPRQVYEVTESGSIRERIGRSGNLIVEQEDSDDD